jgi:diacylglycerol kinase (ATP)
MDNSMADQSLQAKLIYNPASGSFDLAHPQLTEILLALQNLNILPEVYILTPSSPVLQVVHDAIQRRIKLIIAAGGDGTVDLVMEGLVKTSATLGIIPIGTQNNIALSLGIPAGDLVTSTALLKRGHRIKIDVGFVQCGDNKKYFLEAATLGLLSAIFPAADDIQHGNLVRIGDLFETLVNFPVGEMQIMLDQSKMEIKTSAHMALVSNMPFLGAHFQISEEIRYSDGLLDLFVYANLTKLDLLGYAVQVSDGAPIDPRVQHYRIRQAKIRTTPAMPVLADGFSLGNGDLDVRVFPKALTVISGNLGANQLRAA